MEEKTNKFHALQLFTDTFAAETVHLTNEQVGIYIRLLCFCWTKNAKPFKSENAWRICQCINEDCQVKVQSILQEFFIPTDDTLSEWTHKRLTAEHEYLTAKYKKRSEAGKKGMESRYNGVTNKTITPIPIPRPIPKGNIYSESFANLWDSLNIKKGSKFRAFKEFNKVDGNIGLSVEDLIQIYNNQQSGVDDKFVPHLSTWLSQRRWEIEEKDQKQQENPATIRTKMESLGYNYRHSEANFDYFKKDGKEYKIDRYDKDHIIHNVE